MIALRQVICLRVFVLRLRVLKPVAVCLLTGYAYAQPVSCPPPAQLPKAPVKIVLLGGESAGYQINVSIGGCSNNRQANYLLILDTGSANTGIAGDYPYNPSGLAVYNPASSDTFELRDTNSFKVTYHENEAGFNSTGSDFFYFDNLPGVRVEFSVIGQGADFFAKHLKWVGIAGMAYYSLSKEKVAPFQDSLFQQWNLSHQFSLRFNPSGFGKYGFLRLRRGGEMTLGALSAPDGEIAYTPVIEERFYSVYIERISVDGQVVTDECSNINCETTIVDSGTTANYLKADVHRQVTAAINAAIVSRGGTPFPEGFWNKRQDLKINKSHLKTMLHGLPVITFAFRNALSGMPDFEMAITPEMYLRIYDDSGSSFRFTSSLLPRACRNILGIKIITGYITHFDIENKRVGFSAASPGFLVPDPRLGLRAVEPLKEQSCECTDPDCVYDARTYETVMYVAGGFALGGTALLVIEVLAVIAIRVLSKSRIKRQDNSVYGDD